MCLKNKIYNPKISELEFLVSRIGRQRPEVA